MIVRQRSQLLFEPSAIVVPDAQFISPVLSSTDNIGDAVVDQWTAASAYYNYYVYPSDGAQVSNTTGTICDIGALPYVTRLSSGRAKLYLDNGRCKKQLILDMLDKAGAGAFGVITGIVSGSVTDFIWNGLVAPMLTGDKETRRKLFSSTLTGNPASYTLNPTRIAADYDFSGVSVWQSVSGSAERAGVAITRRHLAQAFHFHTPAGTTIRFYDQIAGITETTVVGVSENVDDFCVVTLEDELPASVSVYPIVGNWAYSVLSGPSGGLYTVNTASSGLWLNKSREILPMLRLLPFSSSVRYNSGEVDGVPYTYYNINIGCDSFFWPELYLDWAKAASPGDSSSAMFFLTGPNTMAFAGNIGAPTSGNLPSESLLNALIASADSVAGFSTGLTVTVAPDPTP